MLEELKPCPFCGNKAILFVNNGIRATCPKCGASSKVLIDDITYSGMTDDATKRVIELWNKRVN